MRRSTLLTPISMIVAACVLIGLMFLQPNAGSRAAPLGDITDYLPPTQTAFAIQQTLTAEALGQGDGYVKPSSVVTGTVGVTRTAVASTVTRTAGTPSTLTGTPTGTPNPNDFGQSTATPQQVDTNDTAVAATTESTATPTIDLNNRVCAPGTTVDISGQGPAKAGFLVYFDDRVVSGGTVRRDGRFDISLVVGNEGEGSYPVEVRVRGTRTVLAEFTCRVPATTPTPIAPR